MAERKKEEETQGIVGYLSSSQWARRSSSFGGDMADVKHVFMSITASYVLEYEQEAGKLSSHTYFQKIYLNIKFYLSSF